MAELSDFSTRGAERQFDGDRSIPLFAATVTAFIGRTQRGPLNESVRVGSFAEFCRVFGGHSSLSFLSYAVQQYFQHGGKVALIVRVANRAIRATLELPADDQVLYLQAREPGNQCYLRASVDYDGIGEDPSQFNLVVQRLARPGSQLVEDQELFQLLSIHEGDKKFIVDILENSALIQLARPLPRKRPDATHATHPGQPIPYVEMKSSGSDGEDLTDYDIIGSDEESTGLFALDAAEQVDLLCIPPAPSGRDFGITTFLAAERYCEKRKAILIWDPPSSWTSPEAALINLRESDFASQNAMTYYPRVRSSEHNGRIQAAIPASGVIAGLFSRHDQSGVWRKLEESDMQLKVGLSAAESMTDRQVLMLQRNGINTFTRTDRGAFELCGNVSLAGPRVISQLWRQLDRRRLTLYILGTVERHTSWALARLRDDKLWQSLVHQVGVFLTELFEQGALVGRHPSQAFSVKADPALQRDEAELVLRIGFALETAGEFQVYDIVHRSDGSATRPALSLEASQLAG
ncbi:MAG: hypothetical protein O6700_00420 [Gammaproteobacteria bacterium]|nr:hypothetical protein [Gammaproteobacteria bacterium]